MSDFLTFRPSISKTTQKSRQRTIVLDGWPSGEDMETAVVREQWKLAKRESRKRQKERAERDFNRDFDLKRTERHLVEPGEVRPFLDARTFDEAVTVAREFLLAFSLPDVQAGETLLDIERRVWLRWISDPTGELLLLNRRTGRFDEELSMKFQPDFQPVFELNWKTLPNANEQIDTEKLQPLRNQKAETVPVWQAEGFDTYHEWEIDRIAKDRDEAVKRRIQQEIAEESKDIQTQVENGENGI